MTIIWIDIYHYLSLLYLALRKENNTHTRENFGFDSTNKSEEMLMNYLQKEKLYYMTFFFENRRNTDLTATDKIVYIMVKSTIRNKWVLNRSHHQLLRAIVKINIREMNNTKFLLQKISRKMYKIIQANTKNLGIEIIDGYIQSIKT